MDIALDLILTILSVAAVISLETRQCSNTRAALVLSARTLYVVIFVPLRIVLTDSKHHMSFTCTVSVYSAVFSWQHGPLLRKLSLRHRYTSPVSSCRHTVLYTSSALSLSSSQHQDLSSLDDEQ
jgi:hypothetical protein